GEEGSNEDQDVVVHEGRSPVKTEEEDEADKEFEALLSRTMADSVEKSKIARSTTQVVMGHMAVPMLPKNTNVRALTQEKPLTGGQGVQFKLIKRGNKGKLEAQQMVVPEDTSLGAQVHRNEEASREESHIIKARVLAYEANMEAMSMAEEFGGVPPPEDYQNFIPQIYNAPLRAEDLKGGRASHANSGGGRGGGRGRGSGTPV
ncbi:unnamed protein product, partial [Choristocarpus tenellus]